MLYVVYTYIHTLYMIYINYNIGAARYYVEGVRSTMSAVACVCYAELRFVSLCFDVFSSAALRLAKMRLAELP